MSKPTTFSKILTRLRESKKLSMTALSKQVGVSEAYISFLESGRRHPSRKISLKLAHLLAKKESDYKALLISAGYSVPEGPLNIEFEIDDSLVFEDFMEQVFAWVRQGEHAQAEKAINLGLRTYQEPIHIQLLAAHLSMAKQNFTPAVLAMKTAYELFELSDKQLFSEGFLLLNLGIAHFQQGTNAYLEWQKTKTDAKFCQQCFQEAQTCFEKALAIEASIYLLDEHARVLFNLADLKTQLKEPVSWKPVLAAYQKLWNHSKRNQLKPEHQSEILPFLSLAYARNQLFDQAKEIMHIVMFFDPENALFSYAMACILCLEYEHKPDPDLLLQARQVLQNLGELDKAYQEQIDNDPILFLLKKG